MLRTCICALLLTSVLACPSLAESPPADALAPLQGSWLVKSVNRGGEPQEMLAQAVLTFTQDKFKLNDNELGSVTVDNTTQPQLIDFTIGGDNAPQTVEGIYKVQDDELHICVRVEDVKNRPAAFETGDDGNLILLILQKKKP